MNPKKLVVASALLAVLAIAPLAAQQASSERPEAQQTPLEKELTSIRKMLFNANLKLNRGLVDVAAPGQTAKRTPAQACCSGNLQYIAESMRKVRDIVRERSTCLERKRDVQGVETVNLAVRDLRSLGTALQNFAQAEAPGDARGSMDACTRAFLNVMETISVLPECEDAAAAGAPSE